MPVINDHEMKGIGPDRVILAGSFACNGASDPTTANMRGREFGHTFLVTYAATGIYTVTFPSGYTFPSQPASLIVTPQWDAIANWFDVAPVGESTLTSTTRQLVIQAHRSGVANAPAANAGCRINFMLHVSNNTGK